MSKIMKKVLSVLVCLTLIFTTYAFGFADTYAFPERTGTDIPLIYVIGQGNALVVDNEDGSRTTVYPLKMEEGFIEKTVKENMDVFAKAFFTQEWGEFCDVMCDIVVPLFEDIKLDENGEAPNGSHVWWNWSRYTINGSKTNGKYGTQQFQFNYDWRMDPYKTADLLHKYIEDVLAVTGEKEVALIGRCLGSCICAAYLDKYDGEHVAKFISYASALNGVVGCSNTFSGDMALTGNGIERFAYDLDMPFDDVINDLIEGFITVFAAAHGLDLAAMAVNNVYNQIYLDITPRILINSYGSFPAYWSMVDKQNYEKAKETVFYGADPDKYAPFIDIIDNYHYNIQCKAPELFKSLEADGMDIAVVTKYGYQITPIIKDDFRLGENVCDLRASSYGATTAPIDGTFSQEYLDRAKEKGTDKFISPDLQVDASTCLFPSTTWVVKNLKHIEFPKMLNALFDRIVNNDGYTVFDDEATPQFMVYEKTEDGENISPMTAENMNTTERYEKNVFDALVKIVKSITILIKNALEGILAKPQA